MRARVGVTEDYWFWSESVVGMYWVMRDCLKGVWSGWVESWQGRWMGWGGWGGENEEVAGVRLGVGGRDGAGAGAGGESWAMESQTKS